MITKQKRWTRKSVEADKDHIYIFGDNLLGVGTGGQACIRGLPNAYGIPTKKAPGMNDGDFFTDSEYEDNCKAIVSALARIPYGDIVLPEDGLGTGLAELPTRAPRTFAFLEQVLRECFDFEIQ